MYQRIVVPLDGSDNAEIALNEAESLAKITHASLHLIRVIEFTREDRIALYGTMTDSATILADEVNSAKQYLEVLVRRISAEGMSVNSEVRTGAVAAELVKAAKVGDLYVMASLGRSGVPRWFMGSIAEDVVRRSTVPVLLVKTSSYA